MYSYLNKQNKQMLINTCQILPFFKISQTHAWENDPFFLVSQIRASHWKNAPFFRENGYERGIRFGWEWRGRADWISRSIPYWKSHSRQVRIV